MLLSIIRICFTIMVICQIPMYTCGFDRVHCTAYNVRYALQIKYIKLNKYIIAYIFSFLYIGYLKCYLKICEVNVSISIK